MAIRTNYYDMYRQLGQNVQQAASGVGKAIDAGFHIKNVIENEKAMEQLRNEFQKKHPNMNMSYLKRFDNKTQVEMINEAGVLFDKRQSLDRQFRKQYNVPEDAKSPLMFGQLSFAKDYSSQNELIDQIYESAVKNWTQSKTQELAGLAKPGVTKTERDIEQPLGEEAIQETTIKPRAALPSGQLRELAGAMGIGGTKGAEKIVSGAEQQELTRLGAETINKYFTETGKKKVSQYEALAGVLKATEGRTNEDINKLVSLMKDETEWRKLQNQANKAIGGKDLSHTALINLRTAYMNKDNQIRDDIKSIEKTLSDPKKLGLMEAADPMAASKMRLEVSRLKGIQEENDEQLKIIKDAIPDALKSGGPVARALLGSIKESEKRKNTKTPTALPTGDTDVIIITNDEQFKALPSGTRFKGPDGLVRTKP